MDLNTEGRQLVDYFTGVEVENTPMKGEMTLFVVGIKPVADVVALAEREGVKHIYLGTSQCFKPVNESDWEDWDDFIDGLLRNDLWVTLDFDVAYAGDITGYDWGDHHKFIPMISVKIPNIKAFNYNSTLKLDDNTWGDTNPGVWCHPLSELMTRATYTSWKDYVGDKPVEL